MVSIGPTVSQVTHLEARRATAIVALVCLAAGLVQMTSPFDGNSDVSWLIVATERVLSGQRLYTEVTETNPPMSVFLYLAPVWLAQQTGIAAELIVHAWIIGWALLSIALVRRTMAPAGLIEPAHRAAFLGVVAFVLLVMPGRSFGEREHFALIGLLPFLMLGAARLHGRWTPGFGITMPIGLLAGLAVCIKPHFALIALCPAIGMLASSRRVLSLVTAENCIGVLVTLAYLGIVVVGYPEFFGDVMVVNRLAYLHNTLEGRDLLVAVPTLLALALAALVILARAHVSSPLPLVLAASAAAGACVYLIQAKGWAYHLIPAIGLGGLAIAAALIPRIMSADGSRAAGRVPRAVVIAWAALSLVGIAGPRVFSEHTDSRALEAEIRKYSNAPSMIIFSANLGLPFPLVRRVNATWVARGPSLWITEGIARTLSKTTDPARRTAMVALAIRDRDMFIDEAMTARPDIVGLAYLDERNSYLQWADDVPAFGRFLGGYRRAGVFNEILLFVRRDLAERAAP